jgi:hypothetical protein
LLACKTIEWTFQRAPPPASVTTTPVPPTPVLVTGCTASVTSGSSTWSGDPRWVASPDVRPPLRAVRSAAGNAATLTVQQKIAPLNRPLEKLGELAIDPPLTLRIDVPQAEVVRDYFAPGQFEELTEDEKLSQPSFVQMDAGVILANGAVAAGPRQQAAVEYETIVEGIEPPSPGAFRYAMPAHVALAHIQHGPIARSVAAKSGLRRFAPAPSDEPLTGVKDLPGVA